jgi:hypothetical protein
MRVVREFGPSRRGMAGMHRGHRGRITTAYATLPTDATASDFRAEFPVPRNPPRLPHGRRPAKSCSVPSGRAGSSRSDGTPLLRSEESGGTPLLRDDCFRSCLRIEFALSQERQGTIGKGARRTGLGEESRFGMIGIVSLFRTPLRLETIWERDDAGRCQLTGIPRQRPIIRSTGTGPAGASSSFQDVKEQERRSLAVAGYARLAELNTCSIPEWRGVFKRSSWATERERRETHLYGDRIRLFLSFGKSRMSPLFVVPHCFPTCRQWVGVPRAEKHDS